MKNFLTSKTIWFAVLTAATGVIENVSPFLPTVVHDNALLIVATGIAALRALTNTAITVSAK